MGLNSNMWPAAYQKIEINTLDLYDMHIQANTFIKLKDCLDDPDYNVIDCIKVRDPCPVYVKFASGFFGSCLL